MDSPARTPGEVPGAAQSLGNDLIGRKTLIEDVILALVAHGCVDLTCSLVLAACGDIAVAGGGFCDVYRGKLEDGRVVAIKSLRVYDQPDAEYQRECILKNSAVELYQWSRLQHRNVLPLLGLARFRNQIAMISEWMANGSLRSFLRLRPDTKRYPFCLDICEGLRYIHSGGMVHGDLKADNVMVSADGTAMITDFGSARIKESTLRFTNVSGPAISLRWAAPELLCSPGPCKVSVETDMYALGMTILEVLTGEVPFQGESEYQVITGVTSGRKRPLRPDGVDDGLWERLMLCWDQNPEQRPGIANLIDHLGGLCAELQGPRLNITHTQLHAGTDLNSRKQSLDELGTLLTQSMAKFERLGDLVDLDQTITYLYRAVFLSSGDNESSIWSSKLGESYRYRFEMLGELSDIHLAIEYLSFSLQLTASHSASLIGLLDSLGTSYRQRFEHLDAIADIDRAIDCHSRAVSLLPTDSLQRPRQLSNLGVSLRCRFERLGIISDLQTAIEHQSLGLSLTAYDQESRSTFLNQLGTLYRLRSVHLKNRSDIDHAIDYQIKAVLRTKDTAAIKVDRLCDLGTSYMCRFNLFHGLEDVESAVICFEKAARSDIGHSRVRLIAAREWSRSCLSLGISPGDAYQTSMEILSQLLWHGSTINHRYKLLIEAGDITTRAVAWAISAEDYSCALEWLEAGRFMIWNQILQLQAIPEHLSTINPRLANRLMEIGGQLQETISHPVVTRISLAQFQSLTRERWELEETVQRRHRLANEWGQLLAEARNISGIGNLMSPLQASELVQVAKDGPVVIVNAHLDRCDALIVRPNLPDITHVPLTLCVDNITDILDCRTVLLQVPPEQQPSVSREKQKPAMNIYEKGSLAVAMRKALETLWLTVVKPILDFLGYTQNPNTEAEALPHITWCTTGFLSMLPLHAAGCYDPIPGPKAIDYIISSYTPNLGMLLASQLPKGNGGILAVRPTYEEGKSYGFLDGAVHEVELIKGLAAQTVTPYYQLDEESATVEAVLNAMDDYECVHMACHSIRGAGDPREGIFLLYDGGLTLSRLTRRSTTSKFLAFLSSCYTATGDERLPDEELHFAAGMLVAGYQSVIATMGIIFDAEAPEIVHRVYAELLREGQMNYAGAARALHKAVMALRDKIGEDAVDRWVAFVHIGL